MGMDESTASSAAYFVEKELGLQVRLIDPNTYLTIGIYLDSVRTISNALALLPNDTAAAALRFGFLEWLDSPDREHE
jgi:hypothetical protein